MVEIPFDNIRGLLHDLMLQIDARGTAYRARTRFAGVRPSDIRIFVTASRSPKTMAELARDFGISRQAVQSSVKRLIDLNVVELVAQPNNHRDKMVAVTERGLEARRAAVTFIRQMEGEMAEIIGAQGLEQLRTLLVALVLGIKARDSVAASAVNSAGQATGT